MITRTLCTKIKIKVSFKVVYSLIYSVLRGCKCSVNRSMIRIDARTQIVSHLKF
jgi:hypothetical protein